MNFLSPFFFGAAPYYPAISPSRRHCDHDRTAHGGKEQRLTVRAAKPPGAATPAAATSGCLARLAGWACRRAGRLPFAAPAPCIATVV